jgi:hypothetical protein
MSATAAGAGGGGGGDGGGGAPPLDDEELELLSCTVCTSLCEQPVTTSCGHSYCRSCLASWLSQGRATCPNCRAAIPNTLPAISITLQCAIDALKARSAAAAAAPASPAAAVAAAAPGAPSLDCSPAAYEAALGELGSEASRALLTSCWAHRRAACDALRRIDRSATVSSSSYAQLWRGASAKEAGAPIALRAPPAHESASLGSILERRYEAGRLARPADLASHPVFAAYASFEDLHRWAGCLWPETLRLADLKEAKALAALREHEGAWGALARDAAAAWALVHAHLSREAAVAEAVGAANAQLRRAEELGLSWGSHSVPAALLPAAGMKVEQVLDLMWGALESEQVVRAGLELLNSATSGDIYNAGALLPCLLLRHLALEDIVGACAKLAAKLLERGTISLDNLRDGLLVSLAAGARAHAGVRYECFHAAFTLVKRGGEAEYRSAVRAGWPALCVWQPKSFDAPCSGIMFEISSYGEGAAALEAAGALPAACRMLARSASCKTTATHLCLLVRRTCSGAPAPSRARALNDGGMGPLLVAAGKEHGISVGDSLCCLGRDSAGNVRR